MTGETIAEGWGWPLNSRKAHYFRHTMSLCRRYGFYRSYLEPDDKPSPDDCKACRKELLLEARK